VSLFSSSPAFRVIRISALLASVVFAGSLAAQSRDDIVAERMKPVGEVCLAGEACAAGGSAPAAAAGGEFSVEATYNASCSMCHASGMAGAPRTDDGAAWAARIAERGIDGLVANAISGVNAMPARGMCMTCSDENIAALVEYITTQAQ
jgi:cytochrome c5